MSTLVKETPRENLQFMDITTNHPNSCLGKKTFDLVDEWVEGCTCHMHLDICSEEKKFFFSAPMIPCQLLLK